MCRLVAQGFWQEEGAHYTEKYSPTPATASIRMLLAMAAPKDGELGHFDAEQAFLKADVDEEMYIEIPEEFQEFPGAVGRLNKAIFTDSYKRGGAGTTNSVTTWRRLDSSRQKRICVCSARSLTARRRW